MMQWHVYTEGELQQWLARDIDYVVGKLAEREPYHELLLVGRNLARDLRNGELWAKWQTDVALFFEDATDAIVELDAA